MLININKQEFEDLVSHIEDDMEKGKDGTFNKYDYEKGDYV